MTKVDAATSYVEDNGVETIEKMLKFSNNRLSNNQTIFEKKLKNQ